MKRIRTLIVKTFWIIGGGALNALIWCGVLVGVPFRQKPSFIIQWLVIGGPAVVLFIACGCSIVGWCDRRRLVVGFALLLAPLMYLAWDSSVGDVDLLIPSMAFVLIGIPAAIGTEIGVRVRRRWTGWHGRAVALVCAAVLALCIPGAWWLCGRVSASYATWRINHTDVSALRADVSTLKQTRVVPVLEMPLQPGTNLLWCATWQLAWNQLAARVSGPLHMRDEDAAVALLNQHIHTAMGIEPGSYLTMSGRVGDGVAEQFAQQLRAQFVSSAPPAPAGVSLPHDALAVYTYLAVNLRFAQPFERLKQPLKFGGSDVRAFGIDADTADLESARQRAAQIIVCDHPSREEFVIELKTSSDQHHLYVAMVPPLATLHATITSVMVRIRHNVPAAPQSGTALTVPVMDFDLVRRYDELTGRPLQVDHPDLNGVPIAVAEQRIRFKLDEYGAQLTSFAFVGTLGRPPSFTFRKPFLVLLTYQDSTEPYFAVWVDNAELLARF